MRKPASPESTGGTGFTFEDAVVTCYLASLLLEGGARGMSDVIVTGVKLQRAALGEPLDDMIVTVVDRFEQPARLSLQLKKSITLSAANSNEDFRDVIAACCCEFQKSTFTRGKDRIGLAAGDIASKSFNYACTALEWARFSDSAADFFDRIKTKGFANDWQRKFVADIRSLLPEDYGEEEIWVFLKHLVILRFDVLNEGAATAYDLIERLRSWLLPEEKVRAEELSNKLRVLARKASGAAGSFDKTTLIGKISESFAITTSASKRHDIERISEESKFALQSIRNDVSGMVIPRLKTLKEIDAIDNTRRFVLLAGEAGSGKSAVLRAMAERQTSHGSAMILTDKRLVGPGWAAMAAHLQLDCPKLVDILLEQNYLEQPTLFIDGIDRLGESMRQTVSDIVKTLLDDPRLKKWRIVASTRSMHLEDLRVWLPSALVQENIAFVIEVGAFNDIECEIIARNFPGLRALLFSEGQEREIARRPFFTDLLSKQKVGLGSGEELLSELALIQAWLQGPREPENSAYAISRRQVIGQLALRCANSSDRATPSGELSADVLSQLLKDKTIQEVAESGRYAFEHDIFLEWALFGLCRETGMDWMNTLKDTGDRPGLIRVVELLSQFEFEDTNNWTSMQSTLEKQKDCRHWSRVWLLAPFMSPSFAQRQTGISDYIAEDQRLIRLLSAFKAYKTIENLRVIHGDGNFGEISKFERFQYADLLSWPRPVSAWQRLLFWLVELEWNESTLEDIIDTFNIWLNLFQDVREPSITRYAGRLEKLLAKRDVFESGYGQERNTPILYHKAGFNSKLRVAFLRATLTNPDFVKSRLDGWSADGVGSGVQADVFSWASRIAPLAPEQLANFTYKSFITSLPSETAERTRDNFISWSPMFTDWEAPGLNNSTGHCNPASPLQQPFSALFEFAPNDAIRLMQQFLSHTTLAWRELPQYDFSNRSVPLSFSIDFPWGKQNFWGDQQIYNWFRGGGACQVMTCALMAWEDWAFAELESGRSADDIVMDLVSGHDSVASLGIALGILLESDSTSPVAAALLGCQHLWALDESRWQKDLIGAYPNAVGIAHGWVRGQNHIDALHRLNERPTRKKGLRILAAGFMVGSDDDRQSAKEKLATFLDDLPFTHEEQENDQSIVDGFRLRAQEWMSYADVSKYEVVAIDDATAAVVYKPEEETVQRGETAAQDIANWNKGLHLLNLAKNSLWSGEVSDELLTVAQDLNVEGLFSNGFDAGDPGSYHIIGVTAAAAATLNAGVIDADATDWVIDVAFRAAQITTETIVEAYINETAVDRPETFAAVALQCLIRGGSARSEDAKSALIRLCGSSYQEVRIKAFHSAVSCWREDSVYADEAIALAFKRLTLELDRGTQQWRKELPERAQNLAGEQEQLLADTLNNLNMGKASPLSDVLLPVNPEALDKWRVQEFAGLVATIPVDRFMNDTEFQQNILQLIGDFVEKLSVAVDKAEQKKYRSSAELTLEFSKCLWSLANLVKSLPPACVDRKLVQLLSRLPRQARYETLSGFANAYSCYCVLDTQKVEEGTIDCLISILDTVADDDGWKEADDEFGLPDHLLVLVRVAMGANFDNTDSRASRFANDDWSDSAMLDPLIKWMLSRHGQLPQVMNTFLRHMERSFQYRPGLFLITMLREIPDKLWLSRRYWSDGRNERLAALIQSFAEREGPMDSTEHVRFLELLEYLVDLGDRRAAALLRSSLFDLPRSDVQNEAKV